MTNTTVINLWGGPGIGKSTTAARLFTMFKVENHHTCELVTEKAKDLAWENTPRGPFTQLYLFGEQSRREARLFGKVDIIITDSPVLMGALYEAFYNHDDYLVKAAQHFIQKASQHGVHHENYLLARKKPYNPTGRYEDESTAITLDTTMKNFLDSQQIPYTFLDSPIVLHAHHIHEDITKRVLAGEVKVV